MKAARNTKESIQGSELSSLNTFTNQFVSNFTADKFIAENTKALSDKTLISENISSLVSSFQDDIHPDLNDIIV
jgi:hypothetical protein